VGTRGEAHRRYERHIESASCWPKLLLETNAQIAETARETGAGVVILEVVRDAKAKLGFVCGSKSHGGLGEIKTPLASAADLFETILELQASAGHHDA
jgi:hypothetical protein